jgi:predicted NACHT family NTPase
VAFSADGARLATTSDDLTVRLWDPSTGRQVGDAMTGHSGWVNSVAFSRQGILATASNDQTIRLWDAETGKAHGQPLTGHTGAVRGVAFSWDGERLASAGDDAAVRLWNPVFEDWVDFSCRLINRNLSMTEWHQLDTDLDYERTCPDLPPGAGAPPDAPAAQYGD